MFARVVPAIRTPLGVEHFDYSVPKDLNVKEGDLVLVQFRKQNIPALVVKLLKDSPFAAKAKPLVSSYGSISFPVSLIGLLDWTARNTFSSRPTVFSAWIRKLPKRIPLNPLLTKERARERWNEGALGLMSATWTVCPEKAILDAAEKAKSKRVLIVSPQKTMATQFAAAIPGSLLLLSDLADGAAFRAWSEWLAGKKGVLVTTRVGAWLAPCADLVLLDQPEQDDHKQDELTPRYDARKLIAWSARNGGVKVEAVGITPSLHVDDPAPTIDCELEIAVRHPNSRSPIPMIQSDVLNTIRDHEGPVVIIHPIRGESARFTCRDCGWQAVCASCGFPTSSIGGQALCRRCGWKGDAPLQCGACGGIDLGKSLPGIERLQAAWKKYEPEREVEWRTMAVDDLEKPLPDGSLVVMTDANLLAGVVEDIRRDERLVMAVRRLAARAASAKGKLILQTDEQLANRIPPWLTTEGFEAFRKAERALRASFGYPPSVRLVKAITETTLPKIPYETRGPYPVAFRTKSQKNRFIYHILPPKDVPNEDLIHELTALAKTAILDLDPIAFFR